MLTASRSPSELRNMFGANLRRLAFEYASISALARDLRINRTQFNRYLSGESFPRPDVLARICDFFNVDARVLLEPVENILQGDGPIASNYLQDFIGETVQCVPEADFPSGFYHFSRRSFFRQTHYVRGLVFVRRDGGSTFIRGYEPKGAMAMQGIPPAPRAREYRGFVMKVEEGVTFMVARRNGLTASINYLSRVASFESNFWVGYVTRTVRESSSSDRMTRLVYEYLSDDLTRAQQIARTAGFCTLDDLVPFHRRLLQPDDAFR